MNPRRSCSQGFLYVALTILVSASLLLAPHVPAWATEAQEHWSDSIDEMIALGGYAEGEAIVAVFGGGGETL